MLRKSINVYCDNPNVRVIKPVPMVRDGIYFDEESGVILNKYPKVIMSDVDSMKIPFARRSALWRSEPSDTGKSIRSVFEERVVDGKKMLAVTGTEDWKEFIESSKNETLIYNIMRRFQQGDISVLSRSQGFYGDVTGMPSNLAEAHQLLIDMENQFNSLSSDVRLKFDNSFEKYVKEVSGVTSVEQFSQLFGLNVSAAETPNVESEVTNNES